MGTKKEELERASLGMGALGEASDDEPTFILRAQDKLAALTVRHWANLVEAATDPDSPSRAKVAGARELARKMDVWRDAHGGGKIPD